MNNYQIARVFTRIGDLMEIQGENPFKIRAYRTAAQAMQEMTESLEVLAERGELKSIPGVGDAIADKTREILETGTCKLYERLRAEVPETLVELTSLPGFGTKKIHAVWKELGVRTLDDLDRAAGEHRVRALPGMGAKSEEKLLESIAAHRRRRERTPLWVAQPYAEALARMLRETGRFSRVEVAGSVRRRKDTVGDINLVAAAADPEAALAAFASHAETRTVLHRAPGEMCVRSENGLQIDLRLASETVFGQLWQRFTGSAEHNAELQRLAAELGVSLEAGPHLSDEEALYRALGLPCIVPELREGWGEVEAARNQRLPCLITAADMRGVLHAHSTWSDGLVSIERMAAAARELGYSYHGNTDHSKALTVANGLDEERLRAQMGEIDALNATFTDGFRILKGIECDILPDGSLDLPCEVLEELDIVIASVHSHQKMDEDTMTQRIVRALESGVVDLLAHPTGRLLGHRDPYPVDMDRVMDAAVANKVAMEINAAADRLDLNEVYARAARDRGIPISINTDAHRPANLANNAFGINQARRAWLQPEDVLNTWPLERLMGWLRNRAR